jgi:hypothetical protein
MATMQNHGVNPASSMAPKPTGRNAMMARMQNGGLLPGEGGAR